MVTNYVHRFYMLGKLEQLTSKMTSLVATYKRSDVPAHTMKAYKGSKGIASRILNLGTSWRLMNYMPRPFYPLPGTPVTREQEFGWVLEPV